jgi:hypothetical protein
MSPPECKEQILQHGLKIEAWQKRSSIERHSDQDKRRKNSRKYFVNGVERRIGKERRNATERRDRWIRIGKWRSESVFDE